MKSFFVAGAAALALTLAGASHGTEPQQPSASEYGPSPSLPAPQKSLVPTVNFAKAKPWMGDATPIPASGLQVAALVRGLMHPRWRYVLPNGDILVAESEAPPNPDDAKGIKAAFTAFRTAITGSTSTIE